MHSAKRGRVSTVGRASTAAADGSTPSSSASSSAAVLDQRAAAIEDEKERLLRVRARLLADQAVIRAKLPPANGDARS
jgi:hypothetical protein